MRLFGFGRRGKAMHRKNLKKISKKFSGAVDFPEKKPSIGVKKKNAVSQQKERGYKNEKNIHKIHGYGVGCSDGLLLSCLRFLHHSGAGSFSLGGAEHLTNQHGENRDHRTEAVQELGHAEGRRY